MALKITGPLYGTYARGKVRWLGTIVNLQNGTVTVRQQKNTLKPPTAQQLAQRQHLADAMTAWLQTPQDWVFIGGRWRYKYVTPWPTFYASYGAGSVWDGGASVWDSGASVWD